VYLRFTSRRRWCTLTFQDKPLREKGGGGYPDVLCRLKLDGSLYNVGVRVVDQQGLANLPVCKKELLEQCGLESPRSSVGSTQQITPSQSDDVLTFGIHHNNDSPISSCGALSMSMSILRFVFEVLRLRNFLMDREGQQTWICYTQIKLKQTRICERANRDSRLCRYDQNGQE
jgi:hypothetical protein